MTEPNVFPKEQMRPEYTIDMVKSMAKGLNKSIFSQVCDSGDDELARKTWDSTVEFGTLTRAGHVCWESMHYHLVQLALKVLS